MSTLVFVDPEISTQADRAQSSRVPVSLPEDPYEAIRQAYLVGTDTESEPFEGDAETLESPHTIAPPICRDEESEGSGTSGVRSTSSDSTGPFFLDHPLTHTTPVWVSILRRTARMAVRVLPAISHGLSAGIAEVEAMSDLAFRRRFRSSYDSSPSPNLPVRKRYRGTSKIILDTNSEEDEKVEESSDSDSVSEDEEDEHLIAEDEDPATGDEGPGMRVESCGLDDKGHRVESDGRGVEGPRVSVREDHVYSTFEVGQGSGFAPEPDRSKRVSASRQPTLTTWTDLKDNMVYIDVPTYSPPAQTPPSPEWSPTSHVATSIPTIPVDEDQFIEVGSQLELYRSILQDHTHRLDAMPPTLFAEIDKDERTIVTFGALWRPALALEVWAGRVDNRMTDMSRAGYDNHRLVHNMLLEQTILQRDLQEMRGHVTALEQERDRKER
nr:hypothetical protein [Tanacetum cinerariifolium]